MSRLSAIINLCNCVYILHVAGIQVIEDTATVVQHVRKERGVPQSVPNIVIGGSYGEQLYRTAPGAGVQAIAVFQ